MHWLDHQDTFINMDYGLYLFHQSQQPFHRGHQGVGGLYNLFMVDGLLLLHRCQSLLGLAQGPLHLLQLSGQGFVTLLQLCFHLCILVWNERRESYNVVEETSSLPKNYSVIFYRRTLMCQCTFVSTDITERRMLKEMALDFYVAKLKLSQVIVEDFWHRV